MTIEEQRKAIIEDAKEAGFYTEGNEVFAESSYQGLVNRLTKFAKLQAARNQSNNVPVDDPLSFLKTHGAIDEDGFEYGLCKVKFDSAGKPTHVLWTDIETVIALKKRKGIV